MTQTTDVIELRPKPAALTWVEMALNEAAGLEAAAQANPKAFHGNRVIGMGAGLSRVKSLRQSLKSLLHTIEVLDRVL